MHVAVEMSLYPLTAEYVPPILEFIERLRRQPGLSVVTNADAPVLAPADGWVLYTGNYLNYGQIIILDAGQDYTILLAGMASVDVTPGQFVLMGKKLGTMGSRTIGRTVATSAGAHRPTLYIEMRQNNQPIDPTGWWAAPTNSTQSG